MIKDFFIRPWPWYVAGPLIGLLVPTLLILENKSFGVSSSLRTICAACIPGGLPFFKYDWKSEIWNLFFVGGIVAGALIAVAFLGGDQAVGIHPSMVELLQKWGLKDFSSLSPRDLFNAHQVFTLRGFVFIILGGFLVGFGTRYAGGCTSGHTIMGISTWQWPSMVATCCFMIGGFFVSLVLMPILLSI